MHSHSLYTPSKELRSPCTGGAGHLIAVPVCCKFAWWFGSNGIFARSANTQERGFQGRPCNVDCIGANGRWHCWRRQEVETYALALCKYRRASKVVDVVWKLRTYVSFHFSSIISTFRDSFQRTGVDDMTRWLPLLSCCCVSLSA
jgi:hypothetical protein